MGTSKNARTVYGSHTEMILREEQNKGFMFRMGGVLAKHQEVFPVVRDRTRCFICKTDVLNLRRNQKNKANNYQSWRKPMGLIKSEDLLKQFESGGLFFQDAIRKKIQSMPEGIVRCKDCKWYDPSESLSTIEPSKYACKLVSI